MIQRITHNTNTKFSTFYIIIKNVADNLNLALTDGLASYLGISIDKIKRDFPVVEIDGEGNETSIADPSLSQIIQAINPSQLEDIKTYNGEEFLVIRTPISMRDEADGHSTLDQVKDLVRVMRTGETVTWTGDVYSHADYTQLIQNQGLGW